VDGHGLAGFEFLKNDNEDTENNFVMLRFTNIVCEAHSTPSLREYFQALREV